MAQFKIYGHRAFIKRSSTVISDAIHRASQDALGLPAEKRFHRFLPLEPWQFIAPDDRSQQYLIIELMMFEGRPVATKKAFYGGVVEEFESRLWNRSSRYRVDDYGISTTRLVDSWPGRR